MASSTLARLWAGSVKDAGAHSKPSAMAAVPSGTSKPREQTVLESAGRSSPVRERRVCTRSSNHVGAGACMPRRRPPLPKSNKFIRRCPPPRSKTAMTRLFALLPLCLLACGPAPVYDDNLGLDAIPVAVGALAGTFALKSLSVTIEDTAVLPNQEGGGTNLMLVARTWDAEARRYRQVTQLCGGRNFEVAGVAQRMPFSTYQAVAPSTEEELEVDHDKGTCEMRGHPDLMRSATRSSRPARSEAGEVHGAAPSGEPLSCVSAPAFFSWRSSVARAAASCRPKRESSSRAEGPSSSSCRPSCGARAPGLHPGEATAGTRRPST
jgi:hypothetical protein